MAPASASQAGGGRGSSQLLAPPAAPRHGGAAWDAGRAGQVSGGAQFWRIYLNMKTLLTLAGLAGLTGVALGAFGAHALHDRLVAHDGVEIWRTATLYHLVHAVAALGMLLALTAGEANFSAPARRLLRVAAACWLAGLALFSGSLYALALGGPAKWLGPVTPFGGLALLAGWTLVVVAGWKGGPEK